VGGSVLIAAAVVANRFIPGRETVHETHADIPAVGEAVPAEI
jgi:hypothetical protein